MPSEHEALWTDDALQAPSITTREKIRPSRPRSGPQQLQKTQAGALDSQRLAWLACAGAFNLRL